MMIQRLFFTFLLLCSTQTFALTPADLPADIEIRISGSSSQDKVLKFAIERLCVNSLHIYKDISDPLLPGKNYTSYFCEMNETAGVESTPIIKVLIHKRSSGGSGFGVQPIADSVSIEGMVINNGNCSLVSTNEYECSTSNPGDLISSVYDAGISDVEPSLFVGSNVPAGLVPMTPSRLSQLDVIHMNALIFGIPVTKAFYEALQEIQGLSVGSTLEKDMPSLRKSTVYSLFAGGLTNWNDIKVDDGAGNIIGLADFPFSIASAPAFDTIASFSNPLVHICRRTFGSGAQAQFNVKFANVPCSPTASPPTTASNPIVGPIVQQNSTSFDMTKCLQDKQVANKWALGIHSLENHDPSFRYIKIDGVAPTVKNVANNLYFDWVETNLLFRKIGTVNALSPGKAKILLPMGLKLSRSFDLASFNTISLTTDFIDSMPSDVDSGSYLALNNNGPYPNSPNIPHLKFNPVLTATHAFSGIQNSCSIPVINIQSGLGAWKFDFSSGSGL